METQTQPDPKSEEQSKPDENAVAPSTLEPSAPDPDAYFKQQEQEANQVAPGHNLDKATQKLQQQLSATNKRLDTLTEQLAKGGQASSSGDEDEDGYVTTGDLAKFGNDLVDKINQNTARQVQPLSPDQVREKMTQAVKAAYPELANIGGQDVSGRVVGLVERGIERFREVNPGATPGELQIHAETLIENQILKLQNQGLWPRKSVKSTTKADEKEAGKSNLVPIGGQSPQSVTEEAGYTPALSGEQAIRNYQRKRQGQVKTRQPAD